MNSNKHLTIRQGKTLWPLGRIVTTQLAVFILLVAINTGFSLFAIHNAHRNVEENTQTAQDVVNSLKNSVEVNFPLRILMAELAGTSKDFKHDFERFTRQGAARNTLLNQSLSQLKSLQKKLQQFNANAVQVELGPIKASLGRVIEIGSRAVETQWHGEHKSLFTEVLIPLQQLHESLIEVKKVSGQIFVLNNQRLVENIKQAKGKLEQTHSALAQVKHVFLMTFLIVAIVPIVIQVFFFKQLHHRLSLLDKYSDNIARENFTKPPFVSKDQIGRLAIHLALMGRKIRRLLKKSREETARVEEAKKEIENLAYFDSLTGVPNRTLLQDRLTHIMAHARRHKTLVAVMFIDLDGFKMINDKYGHNYGDRVLKTAADRMVQTVREVDTVARLGGDEFVIILEEVENVDEVSEIAERVLISLSNPHEIKDEKAFATPSIGISLFPDDGELCKDLVKYADIAMYHAKMAGKKQYHFYQQGMNDKITRKAEIIAQLAGALEKREFELVYQPQLDVNANQVNEVEALLRWNNSVLGQVSPAEFIAVAEENGCIIEIGKWVLDEACRQCKVWQMASLPEMSVSVNVSGRQFKDPQFIDTIINVLEKHGLKANALELEITESMLIEDVEQVIETLQKLKDIGVRVALDDFGTGYSSLSYLRHFNIDKLKIDKTFISELSTNEDDQAITTAIINLAKSMNMHLVAEGVEQLSQVDILEKKGCNVIQGYYYSKPVSAEAVQEMLSR